MLPDKGFGFVQVDGVPQEYFLHKSAWGSGDLCLFEQLQAGDRVEFVPMSTAKGLRALAARLTLPRQEPV